MTAAAAAAAPAAKGEEKQAFSTCSRVLYNNARCGQPVVSPAVDFCTHHRPDRIPCPVDPRHFVSTKGLQKHLKKCNATKRAAALAACPFFQEGVNRGRRGVPTALERAAREEAAKDPSSGTKRPRLAPGRKRAAGEMGHGRLLELLARVRRAADEVLPPPPLGAAAGGAAPAEAEAQAATTTVTATTTKPSAAAAAASSAPRPSSLKHDLQNDGIVSIALEAGVFGFSRSRGARAEEPSGGSPSSSASADSVAVVELGAGRGYLGAAAADALVRLHGEEEDKGGDEASPLPLRCSSLTLVDRRAYRNKAERHYRSVVGSGSGGKVQAAAAAAGAQPEKERQRPPFELRRATVDLADTLLASLPGVSPASSSSGAAAAAPKSRQMIALLGKHLCGPATDFALRAAVTQLRLSPPPPGEEGEEGAEEGGRGKKEGGEKGTLFFLSGLAVATCCHHSCCWSDFAGKAEFLALGFSADEFEVVSQASAWATGGHGRAAAGSREEEEQEEEEEEEEEEDAGDDAGDDDEELQGPQKGCCWQSRIPIGLRRASGDAAKRLLDGCRVRWLERRSAASPSSPSPPSPSRLAVVARPYAPEGVTGENRLIVAVPRRRHRGDRGGGVWLEKSGGREEEELTGSR